MNNIIKPSTEHKTDKGTEKLWEFYSKKFELDKNISEYKLIKFALNFINDFLLDNVWNPGFLANKFYTDKKFKKFTLNNFSKKHKKLNSLILEIMDITWMEETMSEPDYKEYLQELRERLDELVSFYEDYFINKKN